MTHCALRRQPRRRRPLGEAGGVQQHAAGAQVLDPVADHPVASGRKVRSVARAFGAERHRGHRHPSPSRTSRQVRPCVSPDPRTVREGGAPGIRRRARRGPVSSRRCPARSPHAGRPPEGVVEFGIGEQNAAHRGFASTRTRGEFRCAQNLASDVRGSVEQVPALCVPGARASCVRQVAGSAARARPHSAHAQFHCGSPPPAAVPRIRMRMPVTSFRDSRRPFSGRGAAPMPPA